MIFNEEYKHYQYVVIKGYKLYSEDNKFFPTTCVSMHNSKDIADLQKKTGTASLAKEEKKMGDCYKVFDTTKKLSGEVIEAINAKLVSDCLTHIKKELEYKFRDKSYAKDASLVYNAISKIVREESKMTYEELVNFSLDKATYKIEANESISSYLHTSCWSYSLSGTWKSCNDKDFTLKSWVCGDVNRV